MNTPATSRTLRARLLGLGLSLALSVGLSAGLGYSAPASAVDANALLSSVDTAATPAGTKYLKFEATTQEPGKQPKQATLAFSSLGPKRIVDFLAPGDVKGTRVLVITADQMYIYLPAYNKVRRVASHTTTQGMLGMVFGDAEFSITRYSDMYTAVLDSETATTTELKLTAKPGAATAYPTLGLSVRKDNSLPAEIRYFNAKGEKLKTETRQDYICDGPICAPQRLRLTDHTRGDAWTELKQVEWKVNTGMTEEDFSLRSLQRAG
jgi:hypothetical protein